MRAIPGNIKVTYLALCIAVMLLIWFALPSLRSLFVDLSSHARLLFYTSAFRVALVNSAIVAILSSVLIVVIALFLGWQFQALPSSVMKLLPLMLFPFIIGPMAYAFSGKLLFMNAPASQEILGQHNRWVILGISVFFYVAHYTLPATFFVFRGIRRVSKRRAAFLSFSGATFDEQFRALVPHELRSLSLVLAFVLTCFVFHDMAASGILYSPSEGTSTQTVSSWMLSTYRRLAANDPVHAADMVMKPAIVIFLVCGVCAVCAALFTQLLVCFLGLISRVWPSLLSRGRNRSFFFLTISLLLLTPYLLVGRYIAIPGVRVIMDLSSLAIRSAFVAFFISGAVWFIAASVRFASVQQAMLDTWTAVVALLCLAYAVSPFALAIASYFWRSLCGVNTSFTACVSLGVSLCGYYLPMMLAFVVPMTWAITDDEVAVHKVHGGTVGEFLFTSVWRRYALDGVVLAVLLFAMCLCEGPITSMYSVWCGSLWELLGSRLEGRGAAFHQAATILFLVGVATAVFTILASRVINEGAQRISGRK